MTKLNQFVIHKLGQFQFGWTIGAAFMATLMISTSANAADTRFRPLLHYTPEKNWMNDPNGMVFYDGEYHLFYQYNPHGDKWGHMSWGHAVSRDLLHWEHLPVAMPEKGDLMIFSGSAVVDWNNTSGFGSGGKPPLVAIYTGHRTGRQDQRIAYSNDNGRSWSQYVGNPVLDIDKADFRDPKVFWHAPTRKWIMVAALSLERKIGIYASPDLKKWDHLSDFGPAGSVAGIWECPDLVELPIENQEGQHRWVMIVNVGSGAPAGGSGCQYFTGVFDGTRFRADPLPPAKPEFVPQGKVLMDFEGRDYRGWKVQGEAFGKAAAKGAFPGQHPVTGFKGRQLVNTFLGGDTAEGTLTSPPFTIDADHISFLIGGGSDPEKTAIHLLVDGKVVRTAAGDDAEPLAWKSWDVSDLRGKEAVLEIVDKHTGSWGHINVDHIILADEPAKTSIEGALWADYGPDFYAAVTWSDVPKEDGREIWIAWMSNWIYAAETPTSPWRGAMSLPRELALRRTASGLRIVQRPVREVEQIRRASLEHSDAPLGEINGWLSEQKVPEVFDLSVDLEIPNGSSAEIKIATSEKEGTLIKIEPGRQRLSVDRTGSGLTDFHPKFAGMYSAPLRADDGRVRLQIVLDHSSIEVFANEGVVSITSLIFPTKTAREITFAGDPGTKVNNFDLSRLAPSANGATVK